MTVRVISTPITGNALTRIGVDRSTESPWFERVPRNAEEWKTRASTIREALITADWLEAIAPALDARGPAAERLEKAAALGFAVTAGQQPGLFGGPLYTWWKALTALSLADRLQMETGVPVVPIFWAATDDSDFAESATTAIATTTGTERISLGPMEDTGRALDRVPLGDVSAQIEKLYAASGSAPHREILELVSRSYSSDKTVGGAYVALLREILQPLGIAVVDAAHPALRAAAFPVLQRALRDAEAVEHALVARSAELKSAGLPAQVKLVKGRTVVFADSAGERERVRTKDAASVLSTAKPGELGPNVLLRPIVERSIIPTVAYIGGPAEIAYFAQVTAVADAMQTLRPVVVPRWSGVVIEPRVSRILERYSLTVEDFRDPHAAETRLARESLPPDVMQKLEALRKSASESIAGLSGSEGADLVSPAVLDGFVRNVTHRLDRLERRYISAVKREGNDALKELAIARASLFPENAPQERALNIVPMLARYGDDLITSAMAEIASHSLAI